MVCYRIVEEKEVSRIMSSTRMVGMMVEWDD
jgi:hypothetical protein